jgi:beta-fructofuranosidase
VSEAHPNLPKTPRPSGASVDCATPSDHPRLVAHWPLDDASGGEALERISGRSASVSYAGRDTKHRPPVPAEWRAAGVGTSGSLRFDGWSTEVSCGSIGDAISGTGATVCAWVAPRSFEQDRGKPSAIVSLYDPSRRSSVIFGIGAYGRLSIAARSDARRHELVADEPRLRRDHWHHVAARWERPAAEYEETIVELFLDGQRIGACTFVGGRGFAPPGATVVLGAHGDPSGIGQGHVFFANRFAGLLSDVRIYGGALPAADLEALVAQSLDACGGTVPPVPREALFPDPQVLAADMHRPQYHPVPPAHWMNEPSGIVHYRDRYHLFYQHNPHGPYWSHICWGHWVSDDMIHWRDLPEALVPTPEGPARDGAWSGSSVLAPDGTPVIVYTAADYAKTPDQCVAMARPVDPDDRDLTAWAFDPLPAIEHPGGDSVPDDFRDPFVFRDEDRYVALVGSGIAGRGGTALVFESPDLTAWTPRGHLYASDYRRFPHLGPGWELPVLLPLGAGRDGAERHLFVISPKGDDVPFDPHYWIGRWDRAALRFVPDDPRPLPIDLGGSVWTGPSGFVDPASGRAILFSILQMHATQKRIAELGWAHNGGLPLHAWLDADDDSLRLAPIEELAALRRATLIDETRLSLDDARDVLAGVEGDLLELRVRFAANASAREYGVTVRRSPGGEEETRLVYDADRRYFAADGTRSSLDPGFYGRTVRGGVVDLRGESPDLRIFIDRSVVQTFVNQRYCLTARAYPSRYDALGVALHARGEVVIDTLSVWRLGGIHEPDPQSYRPPHRASNLA